MANSKAAKKASKKQNVASNETSTKLNANSPFLFKKENYILTIASVCVIALGFVLMSGSEGDIYDARRTTLAPIVVLLGFAIGGYAIFYKSKTKED